MAGGSAKIQVGFRYAFGVVSPILLSLIIVLAATFFHDYRQSQQQNYKRQTWEESAEITMASVRSNLTFADQFSRFGNNLSNEIVQSSAASFSTDRLRQAADRHFPKGYLTEETMIWAFSVNENRARALVADGFEKTRMRMMEKLLNGLLEFANNAEITSSQISRHDKIIKNVLGLHSAPLQLGRQREGRLTPVKFEGKSCFIYWRQFKNADMAFAGWLVLIPEHQVENRDFALRHIASSTLEKTRRHLAVAFVPSKGNSQSLPVILPEQFAQNAEYSLTISNLLRQIPELNFANTTQQSDTQNGKSKTVELADHMFLRDFTTTDIPYDAVVFAPQPKALTRGKTSPVPAMAAILFAWLLVFIYYYIKNGRTGLPLAVSFRVLFLFSGFLPIFMMLALAHGLIEDSYSSALIELRQENTNKLSRINEKSDNLLQLFGSNVSRAINELNLCPLLTSNLRKDAEKAFNLVRTHLEKIELALDYMFVLVPGGISELLVHDRRRYNSANTIRDILAPSIYSINYKYSELWNLPEIKLSASQKNFFKILGGFGNNFLEEVFMYTYEKEIALKFGDSSNDYFYTVAFSDKGRIKSYVGFAANSEGLFRQFLARELNSLNMVDSTIFLAAEELSNSDYSIFPVKKMNVLNSQVGRNAMNFLTKCRGSLFEKHITDLDYMYVFYPMAKMPKYAGGCVVSLAGINRERNLKRLALFAITVLLACLMYIMASFATSHMLSPLNDINNTLQKISNGNLDCKIDFMRSDELGQLGKTINLMLDGFKRRLRLGKFVSTTFERSLESNVDLEESKKVRNMTGTVLFSDIRNFTTLSETFPPEEIAAMLNKHLETMTNSIQRSGGQVEQFIGDAIVAFFPDKKPEGSKTGAVQAALAMNRAHLAINSERASRMQFTYAMGTGLSHGPIIAGPLITPTRSEYCIIGKAKADAEYYEQQSKLGKHSKIIVSADFKSALAETAGLDCSALADTDLLELIINEAHS
ncbi:MAG: HAMP domain-containing protein [Candidatus Riflebacteria bacterium]|nr:HAMP domain-containing protein [Candidatus Riflebacteria bacterium]